VVSAALVLLVGLSWVYLYVLTRQMGMTLDGRMAMTLMGSSHNQMMTMPSQSDWVLFGSTFLMWSIMMVGMMLPSAAPMILLFTAVRQQTQNKPNSKYSDTAQFIAAYLLIWTLFSLLATVLHVALLKTDFVSNMMVSTSHILSGAILMIAALWQWTPWKHACLEACRSPAEFIARHFKPGHYAAFHLGLKHGGYCLGCCWAIMLLLFVAGVMNLLWIALITLFVLGEKVLPKGKYLGQAGAIIMMASGVFLIWSA